VPHSTVQCPRGPFPYPAPGTVLPPAPAPLLPGGLLAFAFADAKHGWVALNGIDRDFGTIQLLTTADSGDTWTPLTQLPGDVITLDFVSSVQGWAVISGDLLATGDGGKTWQAVRLPEGERARYVDFVDARYGWVAGDACATAMLQTIDGGESWSALPVPCGDNAQVEGYAVTMPGSGWLVCRTLGWGGRLWHTGDAGASWALINESMPSETPVSPAYPFILTPHPTPDPERLLPEDGAVAGMSFVDDEYGWMGTWSGRVWGTTDGGRHWRSLRMTEGAGGYLFGSAPRLVSRLQGYVISRTDAAWGLFGTKDGGLTWTHLFPRYPW